MILRRITQHVREQNWFAVGLDFAIVVIGVFIGIQVSNWNEQVAVNAEKDRYLQQLSAEYRAIETTLERHVADYRRSVGASAGVLDVLRGDAPIVEAKLESDLLATASFRVPPRSPPTLQELVSSGKVDLIDNHALRTELLEAHELADAITRIYDEVRGGVQDAEDELYSHVALNNDFSDIEEGGLPTYSFRPQTRAEIAAMLSDPEMETAFEKFLAMHLNMLDLQLEALEETRELNALLAEELGEMP